MRAYYSFLAAALLAGKIAAHPLCYIDDKPTDYDEVLTFCPEPQAGACCTDLEEEEVEARYNAVSAVPLTGNCADLYKEVVCGVCHSYSGHLYEVLGAELGALDGMTMKSSFCEELVSECEGQVTFPTYEGEDYCEKHTGGGDDLFWSYPYEEPEIFEPGLTDVFSVSDDDKPAQTISVKQSPDGSMFWLVGQAGEVKSISADDLSTAETVVDIGGALLDGGEFYVAYEEGLLDVTFGPMFGASGSPDYFYLSFTCELDDGLGARNRLSKFEYFAGDPTATRNSEEILLTSVPRSTSIHAAGWCGFKPSAYGNSGYQDLYWSTGDAGPQTDPDNNGQNTDNLLGSIIRISVPSDGTGYEIPSGNLDTGLPEICASGFRNPWRCSFDRDTDELYCGDVGHTNVEEIDIVECGNNYGWSRFEGSRCQEAVEDNEFNPACDSGSRAGFTFPWFEYCHPDYDSTLESEQPYTDGVDICGDRFLLGHSVIGGYVYRGSYFSDLLAGAYIFGDNTNGNVYFIMDEGDGELTTGSIISDGSLEIIGFAEDNDGELMFIDENYDIYHMPCGDLCATTCLDQVENQPTYTSEGCFADDTDDRGLSIMAEDCGDGETAMSPAICASYCATIDGAVYSAVQYGYECFCGGAEAAAGDQYYGRHGTSDQCNMLCTANPEEICGGNSAMEVFLLGAAEPTEPQEETPLLEETLEPVGTQGPTDPTTSTDQPTTVPVTPTDPAYLGCFSDPDEARMFLEDDSTSLDDMTAVVCAGLCADFPYYGTQYGVECWCGSNDDYAANGEGVCDYSCAGDVSEICGGFYAMSVYENTGVVVIEPTDAPVAPTDEPVEPTDEPVEPTDEPVEPTDEPVEPTDEPVEPTDEPVEPTDEPVEPTDEPVEPTEEPIDVEEPTDPSYLGCFADSGDARIFPDDSTESDEMTAAFCSDFCAEYPFYGTQYSEECWCGSSATYDAIGEGVCDDACTGDASEFCGGHYSMSVYENTGVVVDDPTDDEPADPTDAPVVSEPTDATYLGCWSDPRDGDRMMPTMAARTSSMTAEVCIGLCDGSAYFGTQYGSECWCGDASIDYEFHGEAECDYTCGGDPSEICGGFDAMSVYEVA